MLMQLWIFGTAAAFFAADAPKTDAAKADMAKMQGTWQMVSAEIKGNKLPAEETAKITRVIKGDKYEVRRGEQVLNQGSMTLDPGKKPKTIDAHIEVTDEDGKKKSVKILGIYELDGDTMKTCLASPEKDRPTDFVSKDDNEQNVFVWKRVKDEKKEEKKNEKKDGL